MPKLVTLCTTLILVLAPAGAQAQDDAPAEEAAPATQPAAPAPEEPAQEDPAALESEPEEEEVTSPATQPAESEGAATQPAGPATRPADEPTEPTEPTAAPEEPAGDEDMGPPADASFPGAALQGSSGDPTVRQRRLIAYVSSGVAVAALATGVTLGVIANNEYSCLADVIACNEQRDEPILGSAYLDKKAEVDTLALFADMAYVVTAAATIVAVTGYIRGYWLTGEEEEVTP